MLALVALFDDQNSCRMSKNRVGPEETIHLLAGKRAVLPIDYNQMCISVA